MKILNNCKKYVGIVINAIKTEENTLKLYNIIGKAISEKGEKAFVSYLASILAEMNLKGFSARSLRRMRDFYETYKNRTDLINLASKLNWTQNTVILEKCSSDEEYEFYLKLAISENLSKLALIDGINENLHQKQPSECNEIVSDLANISNYVTTKENKTNVRAFLSERGAMLQGLSLVDIVFRRRWGWLLI